MHYQDGFIGFSFSGGYSSTNCHNKEQNDNQEHGKAMELCRLSLLEMAVFAKYYTRRE